MACTRRVPYFTATSLLQRRVSAFNGACDTPDRGLVKIIGYGIEHRCQFGEAPYAGSHGSSEDVRNPGVFRMEFHGCVHLDWATLEQLPKQFPQLQHVGVYDCPLFDFSLLADPPAHNALPDDFKLDIAGDVSDDDSEVGPDDFGDAIIEEFHVRTIERKIDDLPFLLEINVCLPQPEVTAHLGVPGHSWGVWKDAIPYSGMMQFIWEKPKMVASQPLLFRELLRWANMLEGQAEQPIVPRNPGRLRIRKEPEARGLYTRATFRALLDELSEGNTMESWPSPSERRWRSPCIGRTTPSDQISLPGTRSCQT